MQIPGFIICLQVAFHVKWIVNTIKETRDKNEEEPKLNLTDIEMRPQRQLEEYSAEESNEATMKTTHIKARPAKLDEAQPDWEPDNSKIFLGKSLSSKHIN